MQNDILNQLSGADASQIETAAIEYGNIVKFAEALELWKQVLKLRPDYAQGYIRAINFCLEYRRFRQAEALCLEGIKGCAGPNLTLYTNLAEAKTRQLKYAEALELWAEVRRLFPDAEEGYRRPAMIYRELEKYGLAEEMCLDGIEKCSQNLRLYQIYAELAREGGGTEAEKLEEQARRRLQIVGKFPGNIMELSKLAYVYAEMAAYRPEYAGKYNKIVSAMLRSYNGKDLAAVPTDRKDRPRLCFFCLRCAEIKYYKPVLRYISPSLVDIVLKEKDKKDQKFLKEFGLEAYNVLYGVQNVKNYDYVIIKELHTFPIHFGGMDVKFITLTHTIEHSISDSYIERSALFIFELGHESGILPALSTNLLNAENRELYRRLPVAARCEITHTGMYHIDEFIPDPEFKRACRRRLEKCHGYKFDADKPLVVYMEDSTSHFGQAVYCLNRLCHVANVILKPWYTNRPYMDRLDPKIIVHGGGGMVQNDLRYSADFIMAGYRSGSLISSLLLGIPVIPYYSRIEFHNCIGTGGMILDQSKYIRDNDPYWAMQNRLRKFIRFFDLLKPQEIMAAVTDGKYEARYRKILPQLKKEVLGDYDRPDDCYAVRRTADYILRFAREGTLGKDCRAVYLKKPYFNCNYLENNQI